MRKKMARWFSAVVVVACTLLGLPTVARAAPNPGDCSSASEGVQITEIGTGIKYTCFCLGSPSTGRRYCRWRANTQPSPNVRSQVQLGAEWGLWGLLNYGEVAQTNNGQYKSFGEAESFYNGSLANSPAGWLANAAVVYRWNGSAWSNCRDSGFSYSAGAWAWLNTTWSFGVPPCGDGYYATNSYSFGWDGGSWLGNPAGVWSDYISWVGCLSCLAAGGTPPPKGPPPAQMRRPLPPKAVAGAAVTQQPGLTVQGGGADARHAPA